MEALPIEKDSCTITSSFATREDAENAYHLLMELGYNPEEITLIMSSETKERLYDTYNGMITDAGIDFDPAENCKTISDAFDHLGKFIALPGVSLAVAGDFNDGGVRALVESVMSAKYSQFYQSRLKDGEILIDFQPHTSRERKIITGVWENYGGESVIRRLYHAA